MRRALQLLAAGLLLLAAACAKPPKPGEPLLGLDTAQRDQFDRGKAIFNRVFQPETGLGPLFNANACGECHEDPVAGGVGDEVEVHATALRSDGFCDPLADLGGPVYQQQVTPALKNALGIDKEPIPGRTTAQARRTSPDILGFGLLDAVPDTAILAYADPDDHNRDGISGRPNRFFDGRLGRFGRKALVPTLAEFNEGAFPVEQGVTVPAVPDEGTVGGQPIPAGVDPLPEPELDAQSVALVNAFGTLPCAAVSAEAKGGSPRRAGVVRQDRLCRLSCGAAQDGRQRRQGPGPPRRGGLYRFAAARHGARAGGHLSRIGGPFRVSH